MDYGQLFLGFFAWLGATVFGTAIGIFLAKLYLKIGR